MNVLESISLDLQPITLADFILEAKKAKGITEVKVKKGKMHDLLGLDPLEPITRKYKNGEALAKALLKATKNDYSRVIGMLTYAHNISGNKDIFGKAAQYCIKKKKEGHDDDID